MDSCKNKRILYLDVLKIIAIFCMIYTHTVAYNLFQNSNEGNQWIYMFITVLVQISIPFFFMVSGVLLLNKEESYQSLFSKRIKRYIITIIVFEVGLYILHILGNIIKGENVDANLMNFIKSALSGEFPDSIAFSYWFLYAYIGMLFTLPFLRYISMHINKNDFHLLLILHFIIFSIVPIINLIAKTFGVETFNLSQDFSVPLTTVKALFYPLIGYYIDKNIDVHKFNKKKITKLILIALIGILISSVCIYCEGKITGEYTHNYVQIFDYVIAIVVFLLVKYLFSVKLDNIKEKYCKIISYISSLTFGVYLLEAYLRRIGRNAFEHLLEPIFPMLIVDIEWCFLCFIVGCIITIIIKKIPYLRKLI